MKKILLAISLFCVSLSLFSQTNISGIINSYASLDSVYVGTCSTDYFVDDASGFAVGDSILIMQMKGATIDQTNSAFFGNVISYNDAGKYEKNVIASITGNVITFGLQLANTYDLNSSVQIISVPHYANVNVTAPLTALDWNGVKGGVLAFSASGTVSLAANIDVQGKGFLGGNDPKLGGSALLATSAGCIAVTQGCVGTDYFYPSASTYAVHKGEGIAVTPVGYEAGRGKLLNGGGGGGMSYGGGGGGSNAGQGGIGGGCNNDECSDILCTCNYTNTSGIGGLNLTGQYNNINNTVFMGGGGGAGNHGNSSTNYFNLPNRNGLDGGGIVLITADEIIGNSFFINAKGGDGLPNTISNTGGTGAGGGGGAVLLDVNTYTSNLIVDASGGRGHDSHITGSTSRTGGAGAGGGGGVVWSKTVLPGNVTTVVAAGQPGLAYNDAGAQSAWDGTIGTSGTTLTGLAVPTNPTPAGSGPTLSVGFLGDTLFLCEGQDYTFSLGATVGQSYQWQIDSSGGNWQNLVNGTHYANVDTNETFWILDVIENTSAFYRLMVFNACDTLYSQSTFMVVGGVPVVNVAPVSQTSCLTGDALFYADVSYGENYQWQQLSGSWMNLVDGPVFSGSDTDSLSLTNIPAGLNGAIFRLEITSACGSAFTPPVFLNFTSQPITVDSVSADVVMCSGNDSMMWVSASGVVDSIQWQVDMGSGFVDLANGTSYNGVNNDTLNLLNVATGQDGFIYQAILSNNCGTTETSSPIDLNVFLAPSVSLTDTIRACEGQAVFITPTSVVGTGITYQWQIFTGGSFQNLIDTGAYSNTTASFLAIGAAIVNSSLNNTEYRLLINSSCGTATSNSAYLFVTPSPVFTVPPMNDTVCLGDTATFTANVANGATYQWQSNAGGPFANISNGATFGGVTTPNLSVFNVSSSEVGVLYRLRVTGGSPCGNYNSSVAEIIVGGDTVQVTNTSSDFTYCLGLDTNLYFDYTGNSDSIIWQVDAGAGFVNLSPDVYHSNVDADSLSLTGMDASLDGNIYRAIVANDCGSLDTSDLITVSFYTATPLTYSPSQTVCEGDSAVFYVNSSSPVVSVEWQLWDGTMYVPINPFPVYQGLNSDTLIISPVDLSMDGDSFNVQVVDSCGSVIDAPAPIVLNLNPNALVFSDISICSDDSLVLSDGSSVNTPGFHFDTIASGTASGCDSIVRYNLIILPDTSSNQSVTICFGDSMMLSNGDFVSSPGTYNDTLVGAAANGCDSVLIIDLQVDSFIVETVDTTICQGQSLTVNGTTYTATGIYNDTIAYTSSGCDSIQYVIDLQIDSFLVQNIDTTICQGQSLTVNGTTYTATGIYNDTIAYTLSGCDSIQYVINLEIDSFIVENIDTTICQGQSLTVNGTTYTATGIYNDTARYALSGCDSIQYVIDLEIDSFSVETIDTTICQGQSLTVNGSTYTATGIYNDTARYALSGCDSIQYVIDLQVDSFIVETIDTTICQGQSLTVNGTTYTATGIYNDTARYALSGCDSVQYLIDLEIDSFIVETIDTTLCQGQSLTVNGTTYTATGIYNDTIAYTSSGCDSIQYVIDLEIDSFIVETVDTTICQGQSLTVNGTTYTATGIYNDTARYAFSGCDSIQYVIDLEIDSFIVENIDTTICQGQSLTVNGTTYTATGIYNDTARYAFSGCDSIQYVIDLEIDSFTVETIDTAICQGQSLTVNGTTYTATGIYNDTARYTLSGCDSIQYVIDLQVDSFIVETIDTTICQGQSLTVNGTTYTATGIYNDTARYALSGCDSVQYVIDLEIDSFIVETIDTTLCQGQSLTVNGVSYNSPGIYNDTIYFIGSGCDSIQYVIDLAVDSFVVENIDTNICFGQTYTLNGVNYTATGIYNDTLRYAASGCDSVQYVIDLTIDPLIVSNSIVNVCFGDSLALSDGSFVNTTGIYNDTLLGGATNGCDSIHVIDLTILPLASSAVIDSFCSGGDYTLASGAVVNTPGVYNDTLIGASSNACDSVITYTLNLEQIFVPSNAINDTLCAGDTYTFPSGNTTSTPGTFNDTISAVNGCDSIVVYDIFPGPTNSFTQQFADVEICAGNNILYFLNNPDSTVTYQWMINGVDVIGETTDSLLIANVSPSNDSDVVQIRVMGRCDTIISDTSIITVFTVGEIVNDPVNVVVCNGDSTGFSISTNIPVLGYLWYENGVGLAGTNNSSFNIPNADISQNGNQYFVEIIDSCGIRDTSLVATLIVEQPTDTSNITLCFGDSLQLSDGSFINASGMYNDTLFGASSNGCDSIHFINLTIDPIIQTAASEVLCFGDSLQLSDGSFVNVSGIYNDTLIAGAANGCDSIHIVNLLIAPLIQSNRTEVLCFGDSLPLSDGSFASITGIYNDTLVAGNGCDSIHIIDLSFFPLDTTSETLSICFGDSFQLSDGSFVSATGVYNDTISGATTNGCDSIHIIDLTIDPIVQGTSNVELCFGDSLGLSDGSFVNVTGVYNDTIAGAAANGCDSLHVFNLTIPAQIQSNNNLNICFGDSLQLSDGSFVNATGIYLDTLAGGAANGCDSVNIINLTVDPLIQTNANESICFGDSFQLSDGTFVNTTGTYNDTLIAGATNGCDSIHIINLTVDPLIQTNASESICFGDSFQLSDGSFVNATGVYNDTLAAGAANGCDSIHVINLTVDSLITDTSFVSLCSGDSFTLSNGTVVNSLGLFPDTLVAGNGCDSVLVFNVTILPVPTTVDPQSICAGDFYILPNGDTATLTGMYIDTLIDAASNGCDSIVQTDLLVLPNPDTLIVDSFCSGLSYTLASGASVNSEGIYSDTLFAGANNGCDSLLTYDLSFFTLPSAIVQFDTICFNETFDFNGVQLDTTGFYQDTISGLSGCDSIVAVDLFVRPMNTVLAQSNGLLLCSGDTALFWAESEMTDVTYQWTANGGPLAGQNNDTLIIPGVTMFNNGVVYQLEIISPCDTIYSAAAQLDVRSDANIIDNPVDTSLCEGEIASFDISIDIPIVQIQWYENGVAIPGANGTSYSTAPIVNAQNGNQFFAAVTDSCGTIDSSAIATLTVIPNPVIVSQSPDQTVCAGDSTEFYVNATGSNVTFQWLENGIAMLGETNDTLSVNAMSQTMNGNVYSCQINADCDNLITTGMLLTVNDTSAVLDQSTDITQCGGFSFNVFIDATNIATYQWQINQGGGFVNLTDGALGAGPAQVLGSNSDVLTISNYDLSISGAQFQVITTVFCGTAPIYTPITVTITEPDTGIVTLEDTILCQEEVNPIFVPYVDGAAIWSNGDFGQFVIPQSTGDYVVNYTDANGCPRADTIFIELEDCIAKCVVTAPTGFSPNGSGANDIFRAIYTCELSFYELRMYNRYGELVYMTNDQLEGWNGVYQNENAEIGVYTWYIRYQKEGADTTEDIKGNVTLIR